MSLPEAATYWAFRIARFSNEIETAVPKLADEYEAYDTIPLILAKTDATRAERIAQLPGVLSARPTKETYRKVVWSLDRLLGLIDVHRTTLRPNGVAAAYFGTHTDEIPPYPYLDATSRPARIAFDAQERLNTRLCVVAALNMSVQPTELIGFCRNDAVNVATRAASRAVPLVMAAGNKEEWHPGLEIDGWAQAHWVISVGATSDAAGTEMASYSLIGRPDRPHSGPTVVAWGADDRETGEEGTSFAAPRVADELAVLAAFFLTVRHFLQLEGVEPVEGIPLTGLGYVDINVRPGRGDEHGWSVADLAPPEKPLPALPRAGVDRDALSHVVRAARGLGVSLTTAPTAKRLRAMLLASAEARPAIERHRVGHGFVSEETTRKYLERFNGAELLRLFGPGRIVPGLLESVGEIRIADRDALSPLLPAWRMSKLKWINDLNDFTTEERLPLVVLAQ